MNPSVIEDCFGVLQIGHGPKELVRRFTISNEKLSVQVTTYGATITSIKVPDIEGNIDDVVLGFDKIEEYVTHPHYFGATIGRVANRISNSRFRINDVECKLNANEGRHHLHGGFRGFDKVLWDSHVEGETVIFSHTSKFWDEGYPGEVECKVLYKLDGTKLILGYKAKPTHKTPISLTNHSYFNLGGHGWGKIHDHVLTLNADYYTPVDNESVPTGEISSVRGTPYDLTTPRTLQSVMTALPNGLDLNFCVNGIPGFERPVAKLYHPQSGRILSVSSTQPGVQVYTGNNLPIENSLCGKSGHMYKKYGAICLETQSYPDAVNHSHFPKCIVSAGETYLQKTVYDFSLVE